LLIFAALFFFIHSLVEHLRLCSTATSQCHLRVLRYTVESDTVTVTAVFPRQPR